MSLPTYPGYKDSGVDWLGTVPEHWDSKRLKFLFDLVKREIREEDRIVTCFRDGAVTLRDNRRTDGFTNAVKEIGYQGIRVGDLVIHAMDAFAGAIGVSDSDGKSTPVYSVCTPVSPSVSSNYYARLLRNMAVAGFVSSLAKGIRERSTDFRWADAGEIFLPVPSETEQRKIVSFLDHETARIDALIEEQQRLIELLKEKRQAMISLAVTKGLDPTVPMKDSGVEWLGEVPEHWEVKQLKHVVDPNTSITYGIVQAGPEFEGGIPYIRTSDMSGEALPISGYPLTSPKIDESYARSRVRPGDIVMSIRASVGKCLPVPDELKVANLTQGTAKISAGQGITRNFLLAFLNAEATQNYFDLMAKGATFKEITLDALRRTPVLLPPAGEQIKIDQFVARHAGLLNETCKQAIQSVSLLQERRSALISAAVTGKIDVRGWQPPASSTSPELAQEAV